MHIFGLTKDAQFGQVLSVMKTAKDRRLRIPSKTYPQCQRAEKGNPLPEIKPETNFRERRFYAPLDRMSNTKTKTSKIYLKN